MALVSSLQSTPQCTITTATRLAPTTPKSPFGKLLNCFKTFPESPSGAAAKFCLVQLIASASNVKCTKFCHGRNPVGACDNVAEGTAFNEMAVVDAGAISDGENVE
jgi:hypothetical protein